MAAEPTVLPLDSLPVEVQRAIGSIRAREASARDAAMFDEPAKVGPFRLRQMRPHDALLLHATNNPIFRGVPAGLAGAEALFNLLRILTVGPAVYRPPAAILARLAMVLVRTASATKFCDAVDGYMTETFVDWPTGAEGPVRGDTLRGSFLSHLFHMVATAYHWPEPAIAQMPLRRLLIYRKHIIADAMAEAGKKFVDISEAERKVKNDWMLSVNGGRN